MVVPRVSTGLNESNFALQSIIPSRGNISFDCLGWIPLCGSSCRKCSDTPLNRDFWDARVRSSLPSRWNTEPVRSIRLDACGTHFAVRSLGRRHSRSWPLSQAVGHLPMNFLSCSPACARASWCSAQHRAGRRKENESLRLPSVADAPRYGRGHTRARFVLSGTALPGAR
jgi:hypothetical protein